MYLNKINYFKKNDFTTINKHKIDYDYFIIFLKKSLNY